MTYVHNERKINVAGFDSAGNPFALLNQQLLQDDDVHEIGATVAEWMPYQKGQAAKEATSA